MRRLSVALLLLLVAGAGVVLLDWLTRRMVQRELAERLDESPNAASSELAGLARQNRPLLSGDGGALEELVAAAVGKDRRVAIAAQQEIGRLLESGRPSNQSPWWRRRLASTLRAIGPGNDPNWSAATALTLLHLADQRSAISSSAAEQSAQTQAFLEDCDAVLAAAARTPRRPTVKPATSELPTIALQTPSKSTAVQPAEQLTEPTPRTPDWRAATPPSNLSNPSVAISDLAPQIVEPAPFSPPTDLATVNAPSPANPGGGLDWGTPSTPELLEAPVDLPPPPDETQFLSDRELLARFLPIAERAAQAPAAVGPARRPKATSSIDAEEQNLRNAVIERGFGGVATRHVRMLLSNHDSDRRRLVDQLLTTSSDGAARLLLMLAQDESPAVRHDALRALGSATDPRLVQAAWRMARDDRDPRVAKLVNELRVR